jgi:hypothetical protein
VRACIGTRCRSGHAGQPGGVALAGLGGGARSVSQFFALGN